MIKKENTRITVTLTPKDLNYLNYLSKNNKNISFTKCIKKLIRQEYDLEHAGFNSLKEKNFFDWFKKCDTLKENNKKVQHFF